MVYWFAASFVKADLSLTQNICAGCMAAVRIAFRRKRAEVEVAFAATGEDALKTALLMRLEALQPGDRLTVDAGAAGDDATHGDPR
jgi:hypothetical protein